MHSGETGQPNRGELRNGNPPGDPSKSPRCGARTRSGKPCQAPAMWSKTAGRYTRCRLHGGASTGPRTPAGLERCRRANWKTGAHSADAIGFRREWRREARFLRNMVAFLREQWALDARAGYLVVASTSLESQIEEELWRFTLAALSGRKQNLATAGKNLTQLAESLGYRVTRAADDTLKVRRMSREELTAVIEECLRGLPAEVAEELRALAAGEADGDCAGYARR